MLIKKKVSKKTQKHVETLIKRRGERRSKIGLIYNPAQDDFIPVDESAIKPERDIQIISEMNRDLVPLTLPPITEESEIAGIVKNDAEDQMIGIMDTQNKFKKFPAPVILKPKRKVTKKIKKEEEQLAEQRELERAIVSDSNSDDTETELTDESPTTAVQPEPELELPEIRLDKIVSDLPQVKITDSDESNVKISEKEQDKLLQEIMRLRGEQYQLNEKRSLSCSDYDLEWDPELAGCRLKIKAIIVDEADNLLGYTE